MCRVLFINDLQDSNYCLYFIWKLRLTDDHTSTDKGGSRDSNRSGLLEPGFFSRPFQVKNKTEKQFVPTLTASTGACTHSPMHPVHLGDSVHTRWPK